MNPNKPIIAHGRGLKSLAQLCSRVDRATREQLAEESAKRWLEQRATALAAQGNSSRPRRS